MFNYFIPESRARSQDGTEELLTSFAFYSVLFCYNHWCSDEEIISTGCSPDMEQLIIGCELYYLPRKLTLVVLTTVYIAPLADTNTALDEL